MGTHNPKIRIRSNPIHHRVDNHKHCKAANCHLRKQLHIAHAKQHHDVLYYVEGKEHVEAGQDDGEQEDGAHLELMLFRMSFRVMPTFCMMSKRPASS